MPSRNEPGGLDSMAEQEAPDEDRGPAADSSGPWKTTGVCKRHLGEVCPEVMLIMPFAVPLLLGMRLRKWLRRSVGRRPGNVIGKVVILAFGGPPLLVAFVAVLLMRLALAVLDRLDRTARAWRGT